MADSLPGQKFILPTYGYVEPCFSQQLKRYNCRRWRPMLSEAFVISW